MPDRRLKKGILEVGEAVGDAARRIRGIFDIPGYIPPAMGPPPVDPVEQQVRGWGVKSYDPSRTYCPPVPFTITGVAPGQGRGRRR